MAHHAIAHSVSKALKKAWDESKHPRNPKGSGDISGEFKSVNAPDAPKALKGKQALKALPAGHETTPKGTKPLALPPALTKPKKTTFSGAEGLSVMDASNKADGETASWITQEKAKGHTPKPEEIKAHYEAVYSKYHVAAPTKPLTLPPVLAKVAIKQEDIDSHFGLVKKPKVMGKVAAMNHAKADTEKWVGKQIDNGHIPSNTEQLTHYEKLHEQYLGAPYPKKKTVIHSLPPLKAEWLAAQKADAWANAQEAKGHLVSGDMVTKHKTMLYKKYVKVEKASSLAAAMKADKDTASWFSDEISKGHIVTTEENDKHYQALYDKYNGAPIKDVWPEEAGPKKVMVTVPAPKEPVISPAEASALAQEENAKWNHAWVAIGHTPGVQESQDHYEVLYKKYLGAPKVASPPTTQDGEKFQVNPNLVTSTQIRGMDKKEYQAFERSITRWNKTHVSQPTTRNLGVAYPNTSRGDKRANERAMYLFDKYGHDHGDTPTSDHTFQQYTKIMANRAIYDNIKRTPALDAWLADDKNAPNSYKAVKDMEDIRWRWNNNFTVTHMHVPGTELDSPSQWVESIPFPEDKSFEEVWAEYLLRTHIKEVVNRWAATAGDHDPEANALQINAQRLFGTGDLKALQDYQYHETDWQDALAIAAKKQAIHEAILRAMYKITQQKLIEASLKEMVLYRGMNAKNTEWGKIPGGGNYPDGPRTADREASLSPLASWSAYEEVASRFGGGSASVMLTARVPAERILAMPMTGLGCLDENEFVIIGSDGTIRIVWT